MAAYSGRMIRPYRDNDMEAVVAVWEAAGLTRPWNDPRKDIRRKLDVQREWFLVAEEDDQIVGTVMAGYDGHRGWVNYLAVVPDCGGRGLGRRLMGEVERLLAEAGCPKINLQVRGTNTEAVSFYEHLGYSRDDVVSLGRRLENDE